MSKRGRWTFGEFGWLMFEFLLMAVGFVSGLAVAYRAYLRSLAGAEPPVIDGLTGPQRFFAGWAQVWRCKTRPEETVRRVATDPHAPARFRVHGVLVNSDDFVEAFHVQPGDGMWRDPAERVRIW